jgi:hypothetical protein
VRTNSDLPTIRRVVTGLISAVDWEATGQGTGLDDVALPKSAHPAISPGLQFFLSAQILFAHGIYAGSGTPDDTNVDTWAAATNN